MDYVRLGRSGLKVSRLCMGTMTFGREADEEMSFRLLDRFVEAGGSFVDTADQYSMGGSELVVGRWIKERGARAQIVLATKVYQQMSSNPNDGGLSRIHILKAVDDSLRRLQTDAIDLYQIHRWDPHTQVEETVQALDDVVRAGKVRYIGCSNLKGWQLAKFLYTARLAGKAEFVSLQPLYNALNRSAELEELEVCAAEGLGAIVYNPLAGGMLTGKYSRDSLPTGSRLEAFQGYHDRYFTDEALNIVENFVVAARERGVSPAALALAWVLGEPRVTCPIMGARNLDQLNDTLAGLDVRLSPEERAAIPAIAPGRWVGQDQVYDRQD
jgi:aryl-alcohol dehydrogenase (NADP+)